MTGANHEQYAQHARDRERQRLTAAREYRKARVARGLPLGGRRARAAARSRDPGTSGSQAGHRLALAG